MPLTLEAHNKVHTQEPHPDESSVKPLSEVILQETLETPKEHLARDIFTFLESLVVMTEEAIIRMYAEKFDGHDDEDGMEDFVEPLPVEELDESIDVLRALIDDPAPQI